MSTLAGYADGITELLQRAVQAVPVVTVPLPAYQRAAETHTGAMIALIPSEVDAARLAVADGEDAGELHVTLLYLGKAADIPADSQKQIIAGLRSTVEDAIRPDYALPVVADGFAVSVFNPGDTNDRDTCIVLGLSGGDLEAIHEMVAETVAEVQSQPAGFTIPDQHTPWTPHVTLAYTDDVEQIAELTDRVGPVMFDRIRVAFAGQTTDIPLTPVATGVMRSRATGSGLERSADEVMRDGKAIKVRRDRKGRFSSKSGAQIVSELETAMVVLKAVMSSLNEDQRAEVEQAIDNLESVHAERKADVDAGGRTEASLSTTWAGEIELYTEPGGDFIDLTADGDGNVLEPAEAEDIADALDKLSALELPKTHKNPDTVEPIGRIDTASGRYAVERYEDGSFEIGLVNREDGMPYEGIRLFDVTEAGELADLLEEFAETAAAALVPQTRRAEIHTRLVSLLTRAGGMDIAAWNAANPKHMKGPDGKWLKASGRTGVLGSMLDKLEALRDKLSDDDRDELDRVVAKLRDLESADVDDDDLIEDEPEDDDDDDDDDDDIDTDDDSGDLVMDSGTGELTFSPYEDGDVVVIWDEGNVVFTETSAHEVMNAVIEFNALPVSPVPERTEFPDWVKTEDDLRQWMNQWYESDEWAQYGATIAEKTTSDGELKVIREASGVIQIGEPDVVAASGPGLLQLDDPSEGAAFADMLRQAWIAAVPPDQAAGPDGVRALAPGHARSAGIPDEHGNLHSANNGKFVTKAGGVADKLKLAGRIVLEAGEKLVGSAKVSGHNDGRAYLAVTEKDGQRSVRLGLGNSMFGSRDDQSGRWSAAPDKSVEINQAREILRNERDELDGGLDDLADDPAADQAEVARRRARLDELGDMSLEEAFPNGHTALLDPEAARQLGVTLAAAVSEGKKLQAEMDGKYQRRDDLESQRDGLRGLDRKWTDEEDARWDKLTAEIEALDAEIADDDRPAAGYWVVAEGKVPGQWADVHYEVYLDDLDIGVETKLGAVPHGSGLTFEDLSDNQMHASLDVPEAEMLTRLLGEMGSGSPEVHSRTIENGIPLTRGGDLDVAAWNSTHPRNPKDADGKFTEAPGGSARINKKIADWFQSPGYRKMSTGGHIALDVLGLAPVFGEPFDLANAAWYLVEGNRKEAFLSLGSSIPGLGYITSARKALKHIRTARRYIKVRQKARVAQAEAALAAKAAAKTRSAAPDGRAMFGIPLDGKHDQQLVAELGKRWGTDPRPWAVLHARVTQLAGEEVADEMTAALFIAANGDDSLDSDGQQPSRAAARLAVAIVDALTGMAYTPEQSQLRRAFLQTQSGNVRNSDHHSQHQLRDPHTGEFIDGGVSLDPLGLANEEIAGGNTFGGTARAGEPNGIGVNIVAERDGGDAYFTVTSATPEQARWGDGHADDYSILDPDSVVKFSKGLGKAVKAAESGEQFEAKIHGYDNGDIVVGADGGKVTVSARSWGWDEELEEEEIRPALESPAEFEADRELNELTDYSYEQYVADYKAGEFDYVLPPAKVFPAAVLTVEQARQLRADMDSLVKAPAEALAGLTRSVHAALVRAGRPKAPRGIKAPRAPRAPRVGLGVPFKKDSDGVLRDRFGLYADLPDAPKVLKPAPAVKAAVAVPEVRGRAKPGAVAQALLSGEDGALDAFKREPLRREAIKRGINTDGMSTVAIKDALWDAERSGVDDEAELPAGDKLRLELSRLTVPQLKERAKAQGIKVYSGWRKAEIVEEIAQREGNELAGGYNDADARRQANAIAMSDDVDGESVWEKARRENPEAYAQGTKTKTKPAAKAGITEAPVIGGSAASNEENALAVMGGENAWDRLAAQQKGVAQQAAIDTAKGRASVLAELSELHAEGATPDVMAFRVSASANRHGLADDPQMLALVAAAASGERDKIADAIARVEAAHGLNKQDVQGAVTGFDSKTHSPFSGKHIKAGTLVTVLRPGYTMDVNGESHRVKAAVMVEPSPDGVDAISAPGPSAPMKLTAPYAARRQALSAAAARQPSHTTPLAGGITANSVERVHLPDGRSYVRKDYGADDTIFAKKSTDSEELGALVLDAVGIRTPAVARINGHTVAMEFVDGKQGGETGKLSAPREARESTDGRLIGLADALMGHRDRAGGNWMRTADGRIVPIDNGGAFGGVGADDAAAGNPFSSYILSRSGWAPRIEFPVGTDLPAVRARLKALRPQFVAEGRANWHDQVMGRFDEIGRRATVSATNTGTSRTLEQMLDDPQPSDRDLLKQHLSGMTVAQLKQFAKDNDARLMPGMKKSDQIAGLVETLVGMRINFMAHVKGANTDGEAANFVPPWRKPPVGPPKATAADKATKFSSNPRKRNTWGGTQEDGAHTFHPDGLIGGLIGDGGMRGVPGSIPADQLKLQVRGDSLENVLGDIATDTMAGRMSPMEQVEQLAQVARLLPPGAAKNVLRQAVDDLDVPPVDIDARLASGGAEAYGRFPAVRELVRTLNEIPLARGADFPGDSPDTRELDRILDALNQFGEGKLGGTRFITAIEDARNLRHESREGKTAIDRAVTKAIAALTEQQKADRQAFYPDSPGKA